jgi:hypothetical protein
MKKTYAHNVKDEADIITAKNDVIKAAKSMAFNLKDYEYSVKLISVGIYTKLVDTVDRLESAELRAKDEYVAQYGDSDWIADNTTSIGHYEGIK